MTRFLLALFSFLLPFTLSTTVLALEPIPGDVCTTDNSYIISGGVANAGIVYTMTCQGGVWVRITESDASGNLGIGQASPNAAFHVNGEMIIGNSGLACTATTEGAIRYNTADNNIEVCNGTSWGKIITGTCDNAPAFPSFNTQNDLTTSTITTSNIVAITGMDAGCSAAISISSTGGSPEYRFCSDSDCNAEVQTWTAANTSLDIEGDYIQLRATSSASQATAFTIAIDIGPVSSDWVISTGAIGCAPEGTVCADGTVYAGTSGASTPMYVTRCDAGMTWDGAISTCTGSRSTKCWNNCNSSGHTDTTVVNGISTDGQAYTATLITEDSDSVVAGIQHHIAAQYCSDLVIHGYDDWYLPAKTELSTIYSNQAAIDNFNTSGTKYWSSSEDNSINGHWVQFNDGGWWIDSKNTSKAIRCARR